VSSIFLTPPMQKHHGKIGPPILPPSPFLRRCLLATLAEKYVPIGGRCLIPTFSCASPIFMLLPTVRYMNYTVHASPAEKKNTTSLDLFREMHLCSPALFSECRAQLAAQGARAWGMADDCSETARVLHTL